MKWSRGTVLVTILFATSGLSRADDQDAKAILDKAIKALGGEEKLAKAAVHSWAAKGKLHVGSDDSRDMESDVTASGLNHFRRAFNFAQFSGLVVIDGEKGWRKTRSTVAALDGDELAKEKRNAYLQVIPITLLPLKGEGFKLEASGVEQVGDRPAVILKVTPPDGKDFTISFDKESGVPVKQVAKVAGGAGMEVTLESTYHDYKDLGGIKKATRIDVKRDGALSVEIEITEFKVLDRADADLFAEPK
jgi:hypothetical protein